jgi:hypothetical protein
MSFLSKLFGPSMPRLPETGPLLVIDYAHASRLGPFFHGTLMLKGELAESRWSTTIAEKRNTQSFAITPQLFRTFWRAMDDLPEFRKGWVKDPATKPDLTTHTIVATVVDEANLTEPLFRRRHAIPLESASDQLRDLLVQIGLGSCK